jgi:hypothetical protein
MAEVRKVLGQVEIPATTLTTLYTVPASTEVVASTAIFTNRGAAARKFRMSIQVGGAADSLKQYIYYDQNVPSNTSFAATLGITLGAGDIVKVYASATGLSVSLFGVEIT